MDLDDLLEKYKEISLIMSEKISKEEDISSLLKKRECIIIQINNLNVDKNLICNKLEDLNIMDIDRELEKLIKNSMLNVKKELRRVKQFKEAHKKYTDFSGNALIFSTKR